MVQMCESVRCDFECVSVRKWFRGVRVRCGLNLNACECQIWSECV